jgi:hypothetical protein
MMDLEMRRLTINPLHQRGGEGAERSEAGEAGTHEHLAAYAPIPHLTLALSAPRGREGTPVHRSELRP